MVGNNKVLTVSYGTFSCTLEGFDDSFDTMKAIAEYFRDLAAEDRYFGAEPPQPDAEVMARIAEREVARNVNARTEGGRVLLQTDPPAKPTEAKEVQAEPEASVPNADAGDSTEAETDQSKAEVEEEKTDAAVEASDTAPATEDDGAKASEGAAKDQDEDDRAKMRAKREARRAARAEAKAAEKAATDAETGVTEQESSADEATAEADVETAASNVVADVATEDAPVEKPVAAQDAGDDLQIALENAESAEKTAQASPKPDEAGESLTAKLRRIQAVVGTAAVAGGAAAAAKTSPGNKSEFEPSEYSEDEHAEDFSDTASDAGSDAAEPAAPNGSPFRVLKMKKKDFQAAVESGSLDEIADGEEDEGSIFDDLDGLDELSDKVDEDDRSSSLSAEEEEDLARELAALEKDDSDLAAETPIASDAEDAFEEDEAPEPAPTKVTAPGRAVLEQQADTAENAVSRLLEKTEEAMDEPANKTRRNAISHLKAAVAATVADRKVGGQNAVKTDEDQPYREDLARVVRPKRPAKPAPSDAPKQDDRPKAAPLKLVASQRVDAKPADAEATPAQPVRPRRVATKPKSDGPAPEFAAFAASAGADGVPDMLEAAAAYTTCVEGNDIFSRPQVMRLVQSALPDGTFSREDGLRAFGTLLRQGRLKKIRGGQFEVTKDTRFVDAAQTHSDERAAG